MSSRLSISLLRGAVVRTSLADTPLPAASASRALSTTHNHYGEAPLENVVTIHGFMGSNLKMATLSRQLKNAHVNPRLLRFSYPSRKQPTEVHRDSLVEFLNQHHAKDQALGREAGWSYVTHSYGANVLRAALNHPACPEKAKHGRAVLIAPPYHGSMFARDWADTKVGQLIMGPGVGKDLLQNTSTSMRAKVGDLPASLNVMVIAGTAGINPFTKLPQPHDGVVTVDETRPHEVDHSLVTVPVPHYFMLFHPDVISRTVDFLTTGTVRDSITSRAAQADADAYEHAVRTSSTGNGSSDGHSARDTERVLQGNLTVIIGFMLGLTLARAWWRGKENDRTDW